MTSPTAGPVSLVTSRDPVGRHLGSVLDHEIDDARLSLEEMRRVNNATPEFKAWVAEFIARKRIRHDYANEEVPSSYGYISGYRSARPLQEQADRLKELFPEFGQPDKNVATQPLVRGSEGFFAIGRWQAVAQTYGEACQRMVAALTVVYGKKFVNFLQDKLGPQHLREHALKVGWMERLTAQQPGRNLLVIQAQLGIWHRGKSVRYAITCFTPSVEFGLGLFEVGCALLTHTDRFADLDDLWIDCPGDQVRREIPKDPKQADDGWVDAPLFDFDGEELKLYARGVSLVHDGYGSASGFLPVRQAGVPQSDRAS